MYSDTKRQLENRDREPEMLTLCVLQRVFLYNQQMASYLTYGVSQGEVIALRSKDGIQTSLTVSALWTGHHQCQHTYQDKHGHLQTSRV